MPSSIMATLMYVAAVLGCSGPHAMCSRYRARMTYLPGNATQGAPSSQAVQEQSEQHEGSSCKAREKHIPVPTCLSTTGLACTLAQALRSGAPGACLLHGGKPARLVHEGRT